MKPYAVVVAGILPFLWSPSTRAASFTCVESQPQVPLNPGCFVSFEPPNAGDCNSSNDHFLLQVLLPNLATEHRVTALAFWSNDASTVFPAAGVIVTSLTEGGEIPLPTATQLASLQASDISSAADTSRVLVDLQQESVLVPPGAQVVLFAAIRFPSTGTLTQIGAGPGILVDATLPDQECDFFSLDGGDTWQAPLYVPGDPLSEPLDWGFEVLLEPTNALAGVSWSHLKQLFRTP